MESLVLPVILGILTISIILSLIYRFIYHHHYLELGENEVVYYTGILNIRAINVPYQKIDNVRTERPLLSRFLGLVNIYIDTPGEKGIEIIANDMPYSKYKEFYELLRKKMEEKRHGGGYPWID